MADHEETISSRPLDDETAEPSSGLATAVRATKHNVGSASILVAALRGVSMALDWEFHKEEPVITVNAPDDQDWLDLDTGHLEQLGHSDEV